MNHQHTDRAGACTFLDVLAIGGNGRGSGCVDGAGVVEAPIEAVGDDAVG